MEYLGAIYNYFYPSPDLESTFIEAISDTIRPHQNQDLFYLGTSDSMQIGFQNYVGKKFTAHEFEPGELALGPIILSIWKKTKESVESQLLKSKDEQKIFHEIKWQLEAEKLTSACIKEGHTGRFFTARQIKAMLNEIDNV